MKPLLSLFCLLSLLSTPCWCSIIPKTGLRKVECCVEAHPLPRPSSVPKNFSCIERKRDNWCGYIASQSICHPKKKTVRDVAAHWIVPTIEKPSQTANVDIFVGINGDQIGTGHLLQSDEQINFAWYEIFPNFFVVSSFPIENGDEVGGEVEYKGNGAFELTIFNFTQGTYASFQQNDPTSKRDTSEWIVMAPSFVTDVGPLSQFHKIHFSKCMAKIAKKKDSIDSHHWQHTSLTMRSSRKSTQAVPSSLSSHGKKFSVTWKNSGE